MNISILPCIKNKCLLLPACKNKEYITCDILFDQMEKISPKYMDSYYNKIRYLFPNSVMVTST